MNYIERMEKETAERKLKFEIELLKIYTFFIALTGTGFSSLLFEEIFGLVELSLFILGFFVFSAFVIVGIVSFLRIKKLYKLL